MIQIKVFTPEEHWVKALIYGPSGSGKTFFAGTAPDVIFASAEGGLLTLKDKNPHYVDIRSLNDLRDFLNHLKTKKHEYKTVVIDSITEINDIIKDEIEARTKRSIQKGDWEEVAKKVKNVLRMFRDLPMHVIFIALEKVEKDGDEILKILPELNGKSATGVARYMDVVGYVRVEADGTRKIITESHPKLLSKNRGNCIPNDTKPDFKIWIKKASKIKTGEQEVIADIETPGTQKVTSITVEHDGIDENQIPILTLTSTKLLQRWGVLCDLNDIDISKRNHELQQEVFRQFRKEKVTHLSEAQGKKLVTMVEQYIKVCEKKLGKKALVTPPPAPPKKTLFDKLEEENSPAQPNS